MVDNKEEMAETVLIRSGAFEGAAGVIVRRFKTKTKLRATRYFDGDNAYLETGEEFTVLNSDLPEQEDLDQMIKDRAMELRSLLLKRQYKEKRSLADKEIMNVLKGI